MNLRTPEFLRCAAALVLGGIICAGPARAQNPLTAPDDSWITVSGAVTQVTRSGFELDYGPGSIVVEMDASHATPTARALVVGDQVRVKGKVDDDLFEARTLEASLVYVVGLGAYYEASAADEEDFTSVTSPLDPSILIFEGTVTAILPPDEFVLKAGSRRIIVNTKHLPYDPLGGSGEAQIVRGELVRVTGQSEKDLLKVRKIDADTVVEIARR